MKKLWTGCAAGLALLALCSAVAAEDTPTLPKSSLKSPYPTIPMFELIDRVAKKTGKRFVVDPRANVEVPLPGLDARDIDYPTLLAVIRLQQLAAFTQDGVVNVMPDSNARQVPTPVLTSDDPKIGADEFVTRVIRVENVCTNWLVPILRPLMPQSAHLASHSPSHSLLMSDRAGNVRRIAELVTQLDRPPKQNCEVETGK